MKRKSLLTLFLVLMGFVSFAQKLPDWIINKPTPSNNTYLYVVESATGQTEMQARNRAIAEVFRSTAMRIGQPVDSEEINRALQRGTEYYVISSQYNVPINKVCEYTDNKTSPCRVYVLCQVAKAGNIRVEFDDFNACYEGVNKFYAEEALVANGFSVYKNGKLIKENEVRSLFANSQAYDYYDKGMSVYYSSFWNKELWGLPVANGISYTILALGGTMALMGYGLAPVAESDGDYKNVELFKRMGKTGLVTTGIGCALLFAKAAVNASGKAKIRKAVNLYNNGRMYSQSSVEMQYGLTANSVYVTFRF